MLLWNSLEHSSVPVSIKLFSWRKYTTDVLLRRQHESVLRSGFCTYTYIYIYISFYSFSNLLWLTPSSADFDVCINYYVSDLLGLRSSSHALWDRPENIIYNNILYYYSLIRYNTPTIMKPEQLYLHYTTEYCWPQYTSSLYLEASNGSG